MKPEKAMKLASEDCQAAAPRSCGSFALLPLRETPTKPLHDAMSKSIEVISEVIRDSKHPFRQVDDRPDKQKKHQYERRKVKEIIRAGDWSENGEG